MFSTIFVFVVVTTNAQKADKFWSLGINQTVHTETESSSMILKIVIERYCNDHGVCTTHMTIILLFLLIKKY